jgi:hypothetical protein
MDSSSEGIRSKSRVTIISSVVLLDVQRQAVHIVMTIALADIASIVAAPVPNPEHSLKHDELS